MAGWEGGLSYIKKGHFDANGVIILLFSRVCFVSNSLVCCDLADLDEELKAREKMFVSTFEKKEYYRSGSSAN